jgi:hypothetical protein
LTTGCMALFMSWIWQNWWTQANAIIVSSHPDTVVIEADHTTPVTMEIMTYKEY